MDIYTLPRTVIFGSATLIDLKHWLEARPRTNPSKYLDELSRACSDLAQLEIESCEALKLLDELRLHIFRHCTKLSHQYLNQSIDLPLHMAELVQHASLLWQRLGQAYLAQTERDRGFAGIVEDDITHKPTKSAITCLHRAIHCQQQILLQNILLYRSDKPGQWFTMHQRYALSLKHQIQEHRINDPLNPDHPISCITDLYASICLLRIANCNQLNQLEIINLWQFIQKFSVLIEINNEGESHYGMQLNSDHPPMRNKQFKGNNHDVYTLFYSDLLDRIMQAHNGEDSTMVLNKRLRNHTMRALSGNIERVMPRHNIHKTVDVCFGLNNSWLAFSHQRNLDEMTRHLNNKSSSLQDDSNPLFSAKREHYLLDQWDDNRVMHLSDKAVFQADSIMDAIRASQPSSGTREHLEPTLIEVDVMEHSATGFCLKMPLPLSTPIRNGDILALREQHDDRYMLCAIRWVLSQDDHIMFGVEIIAPTAACFGARMLPNVGDINDERFSECLLLPEIPSLNIHARLLLPSAPFISGGKLQLLRDELEMTVKLNDVEQASFSYSIFKFEDLKDVMNRMPMIGLRIQSNDKSLGKLFV